MNTVTEKQTDEKNQIWFQKEGETVRVGFTANFLEKMDECWHIMPSGPGHMKENDPLVAVETNDSLLSIRTPIAGKVFDFSSKALNFPDKLTPEDVLLYINTKPETKKRSTAKKSPVAPIFDWNTHSFPDPEVAGNVTNSNRFRVEPHMRGRTVEIPPTDPVSNRIREQIQNELASITQHTLSGARPLSPREITEQVHREQEEFHQRLLREQQRIRDAIGQVAPPPTPRRT